MGKVAVWKHVVTWACLYVCWLLVFHNRAFTFYRTMSVEFCYLLFIAANFYVAVYYLIPRFLYQKKYVAFGLLLLGGILAGALLRVPLATYLNKNFFLVNQPQPGYGVLFVNSFVNIFFWVVCAVAGNVIADKIRFQQHLDRVEKERSKNELDFLKAQFNPHFLFNSINSIYGHIEKGNATARNMLLTFSEMLRYQLYECNVDRISIEKEISYIRNYVRLQQTRKEETLVVNIDIHDNVKGFSIAPLLFIAFIENAFKYVSDNEKEENRVDIRMEKQDNRLLFCTYNTKDTNYNRMTDHSGIGIANVKRRLALLYPGKHDLSVNETDSSYEVQLNLAVS